MFTMTELYTKLVTISKEIRIWQWTKNVLVFAPLIFGAKLLDFNVVSSAVLTFFAISFAASAVYVINDILDVNDDRKHPVKKNRPIASGAIGIKSAYLLATTLFVVSMAISAYISVSVLLLVLAYLVLNLLYSKILKHKEIVDILLVAFFYLYRVYLGGVATGLSLSGWLILTTFFLSLFMIAGKRRAELVTAKDENNYSRKVLNFYNEKFLDAALIMSLTLFIVFYSLYSVLVHSGLFVLTIFPILFISLRYLYLIFARNDGEEPEKLIFKDKEILLAGIILGALIVAILYFGASDIVKI